MGRERAMGIEPTSARWQRAILPLNHARSRPKSNLLLLKNCPGQELNLQASRHTHLKRTCLPIPPPGHKTKIGGAGGI